MLQSLAQIILVEDDLRLSSLVKDFLEKNGIDVFVINDGSNAVSQILNRKSDIVILDIMLPGMDGLEICRNIRNKYKGSILILTAMDDEIQSPNFYFNRIH